MICWRPLTWSRAISWYQVHSECTVNSPQRAFPGIRVNTFGPRPELFSDYLKEACAILNGMYSRRPTGKCLIFPSFSRTLPPQAWLRKVWMMQGKRADKSSYISDWIKEVEVPLDLYLPDSLSFHPIWLSLHPHHLFDHGAGDEYGIWLLLMNYYLLPVILHHYSEHPPTPSYSILTHRPSISARYMLQPIHIAKHLFTHPLDNRYSKKIGKTFYQNLYRGGV